jgi:hypothetical protein
MTLFSTGSDVGRTGGVGNRSQIKKEQKQRGDYVASYEEHTVWVRFFVGHSYVFLELKVGFEPTTCGLRNRCSTAELLQPIQYWRSF